MYIIYGLILAIVFFAVQLILCLKVKPLAVRLIPAFISAAVFIYYAASNFGAFSWYLSAPDGEVAGTVFSFDFLLFLAIYLIMFMNRALLICFGDGMAWVAAAIIKRKMQISA